MKIVELKAENVKRLSAVEITPDGTLVVIGGENGEGKSSVLDSILYALGGAKSLCKEPVHRGEKAATIEVSLDSEPPIKVTRKIQKNGKSTLEIKQTNPSGMEARVSSPQRLLDSLCGKIAFDPLAFTRLRPQEQVKLLREVVGLDTTEIDSRHDEVYEARTELNREKKVYTSQLETLPEDSEAPAELIDVANLVKELTEINAQNQQHNTLERQTESAQQALQYARDAYDDAKAKLEAAGKVYSEAAAKLANSQAIDEAPIKAEIANAEAINTRVRTNKERAEVLATIKALDEKIDDHAKQLDTIRSQRVSMLNDADWPLEGLGFSEDGVTFDNLPFEQCSSAEQLKISTAIGLSQNPQLRVMLIRDGSLLDASSLAMLGEIAAENHAQIWVERVGKGEECSVVIEDGSVAETRSQAKVAEVAF